MSARNIIHPRRGRVKVRAQYVKPTPREGHGRWLLAETSYSTESMRRYTKQGLAGSYPVPIPARTFGTITLPARTVAARRARSAYGRKTRINLAPTKGILVFDSKRGKAKTVPRHQWWW